MMKKHTFPREQEEMPIRPERPEIKQPADPKEPEIPEREIDDIPPELPPDENEVVEKSQKED
jgi:hypothetical protein